MYGYEHRPGVEEPDWLSRFWDWYIGVVTVLAIAGTIFIWLANHPR